jgi:hypothetical protein
LQAFRSVSGGESPYLRAADGLDFLYPPPFAWLGARALEALGERAVVLILRLANLLGLAVALWCSFRSVQWRPAWSLATATAYVLLAPPSIRHGLGSGNASFAVVGAILLALALSRRHPWSTGLLLGVSGALKPIAPVGLVVWACHRSHLLDRRRLRAAAVGAGLAGALFLASPFLHEFLSLELRVDEWPLRRSVSLFRWLHLTGLPISALGTLLLVTCAALWIARRAPLSLRQFEVVSIVGMTLATSALWSHTLLLALPLQVMAFDRWLERRRRGARVNAALERYELAFVALAAASLQFVDGIGGGVEVSPRPVQLLVLAVPLVSLVGLGAYSWRSEGQREGSARGANA